MYRFASILLVALVAFAASAQNTDIEALAGLQFNFGNPGARALGMGGAFIGLADDASAAEANPAGLTILRKPEVSIEARSFTEQQVFTTGGTFPNLIRTPFTHHSERVLVTFASAVYPFRKVTLGAYFHEPLRNSGGGAVFPERDDLTGEVSRSLPNFYLPTKGTGPVSKSECDAIKLAAKDPFACLEYRIDPFISVLAVRQQTFGLAAGWQVHPKFSIGATARYQRLNESAATLRYKEFIVSGRPTYQLTSISYQATADTTGGDINVKDETDVTFGVGFKWTVSDRISVGGAYKQGGRFSAPLFFAGPPTGGQVVEVAQPEFHMPDVAGLGLSYRPIPVLTLNLDAVHVKYSNLVDDFISLSGAVRALDNPYEAKNALEMRFGAEYFLPTKIPVALRGGVWREPAHSVEYRGPLNNPEFVAEAMLYPKGEDRTHLTAGAGIAWPLFQIDLAYDHSERFKVGSLSAVVRF